MRQVNSHTMNAEGGILLLSLVVTSAAIVWSLVHFCKNTNNAQNGERKKKRQRVRTFRALYATTTGTSKSFAEDLATRVSAAAPKKWTSVDAMNLRDYDQDNLELENVVVFVVSTWSEGRCPKDVEVFFRWIEDMSKDFRVGSKYLSGVKVAVFGLGNRDYDENFCRAPRELYEYLMTLGAEPIRPLGLGDDNVDQRRAFVEWSNPLIKILSSSTKSPSCAIKDPTTLRRNKQGNKKKMWLSRREMRRQKRLQKLKDEQKNGNAIERNEEDLINDKLLAEADVDDNSDEDDNESDGDAPSKRNDVLDVEDLSAALDVSAKENDRLVANEMVTPKQRTALTKEGYKIIGTHSAVKLCRWTKHQLRGRGGCYKHTCYGITSYQCMEATPSLACANKCVFCWRHHKNPVGREWRWKQDDPNEIVNQAISKHRKMIKEFRGVKGVKMDRWKEAMTVRHCALSLVGEPIMYPKVNELLRLLHDQRISTFLVTNAQFPERIRHIDPVTQLYVSIDAATPETLKAVDRPLFKDFWKRFVDSLDALREKRQRTVYRLTLVKGWNMQQIRDYAKLVSRGKPDFIEIKAVTYSGKSDGSSLTMKNVPWHEEVRKFSEALCDLLGSDKYGLAAAHEHSCLVLLAQRRFCVEGAWHTWIDYERFDQLMRRYYESGGKDTFTAMDYIAPTPQWALYDAKEAGFDPKETRFRRTRKGKVREREYKPSSSGCG